MIRPAAFEFNAQTAVNNAFQKAGERVAQEEALKEFDNFVQLLCDKGVEVTVIQDSFEPHTPDSIFPNNWVSFHEDGSLVLYPMFAPNRRNERNKNIIDSIADRFYIRSVIDLTHYESIHVFLEGTGSMVLDRENEYAYACLSARTNPTSLYDFCNTLGYRPVLFNAVDDAGNEIYHTNVMMCIADEYVVICLDTIKETAQKTMLLNKFEETGKTVMEISMTQMKHFAGNTLQVENRVGKKLLVMSTQAYQSLSAEQVQVLESFNPILHAPLNTIEQNGGGSARCMMAEIFLPLNV